jgi:hypothetical protein
MIIDINQAKIAIADKYKVFVNEQEQYRAARKLWRILPEVDLFRLDDSEPRLTLKKRFSLIKASYDIRRGGDVFPFTTISVLKHHYTCTIGADRYDIYGHRGRKYSIFKNDRQVAWWDKAAVTWFAGDNYRITADNNADREALIAFCLIIDNFRSDDHNETVSYDVGNLGFQAKKFDPEWQPSN